MPLPSHLYRKLPPTENLCAPGRAALDPFWSKQGSSKNSTWKVTDNLARRGLPAQCPPLSYPLVQPPHFGLEAGRLISRSTFGAPCVCPQHSPSAVPFFFPCPARACPSLLSQRRMLSPTDTLARAPRQSGTLQPRTPKALPPKSTYYTAFSVSASRPSSPPSCGFLDYAVLTFLSRRQYLACK